MAKKYTKYITQVLEYKLTPSGNPINRVNVSREGSTLEDFFIKGPFETPTHYVISREICNIQSTIGVAHSYDEAIKKMTSSILSNFPELGSKLELRENKTISLKAKVKHPNVDIDDFD